ncbi:hypothetical protein SULYE_1185 [Sulfurihydrogenibium yellowstonense SS-5]|uniref:Uncharacterized protein n=1 Tax=Sulfurihydrogenibium yellowstonense SS-5 TaxID=432331 RepID=C4FKT5_9AQUI|nr:hypothetical protein SULYE_1185 [Sulfurihydrogenibium yellowstonense SS-5]
MIYSFDLNFNTKQAGKETIPKIHTVILQPCEEYSIFINFLKKRFFGL